MSRDDERSLDEMDLELSDEDRAALDLSEEPDDVRLALEASQRRREMLEDPRWDALIRGTISNKERAELRQRTEESQEAKDLWDLVHAAKEDERPAVKGGTKKPITGLRGLGFRRAWPAVATAVLMAAGVLGVWLNKRQPEQAMASYSVFVDSGEKFVRGADAKKDERHVSILRTNKSASSQDSPKDNSTPFMMTLTPRAPTSVPITARVYLARFGAVIPLDVRPRIDEASGRVILEGTRESLFPHMPSGDYEVWIAVGSENLLPGNPSDLLLSLAKKEKSFALARTRIRFEGGTNDDRSSLLLDVAYSGCNALVTPQPPKEDAVLLAECQLSAEGKLNFWAKVPPGANVKLRAFDEEIALESNEFAQTNGKSFEVPVKPISGSIVIDVELGGRHAAFFLPIAPLRNADVYEKARQLASTGQREEAFRLAEGLLTDPSLLVRARAMGLLGRIERDAGTADKLDGAIEKLKGALDLDRQAGGLSDELRDAVVLSRIYNLQKHDVAAGKRIIESLASTAAQNPDTLMTMAQYLANAEAQLGDVRRALVEYERALRWSKRLGDTESETSAMHSIAEIFARIGRTDEAREIIANVRTGALAQYETNRRDACNLAIVENEEGWIAYLTSKSPGAKRIDPLPMYERALSLPCEDGLLRGNVYTNEALVALDNGSASDVFRYLKKAREEVKAPESYLEDWWKLLEGRAWSKGPVKEIDAVKKARDTLGELANQAKDADVRLEAKIAYAETLDELRDPGARAAYAEADAEAERYSNAIALGTGSSGFLSNHARATERRIDYLLRLADEKPAGSKSAREEAARVARLGRARGILALQRVRTLSNLSRLDKETWIGARIEYERKRVAFEALAKNATDEERGLAQQDAQKALDKALSLIGPKAITELPQIADEELLLVFHSMDHGYVAFAITKDDIQVHRIASLDPKAETSVLAATLLEPFRSLIDASKRIRIAPHGALVGIDFHALPWDSEPLVAKLPVVYAVDGSAAGEREMGTHKKAVLLGNTRRDLSKADDELATVSQALGKLGYSLESPLGDTTSALRASLSDDEVGIFHFAGHAEGSGLGSSNASAKDIFRANLDGWQSGLRMGNGSLFSVADVIALSTVPKIVILSGCETGTLLDVRGQAGIGLAQAFITKGARGVIATTGKVDDELTLNVMTALYRSASFPGDLAEALREAVLKNRRYPAWTSFRVVVP